MKSTDSRLVSIVVVTLNEAKRLPALFQSVLDQDYKDVELIVCDSTKTSDNTAEVVSEWSQKLKITHIYKNTLLGAGRLEGAKVAAGKYLLHIDADMRFTSGLITECVRHIDAGADAIDIPEEVIGEGFWTKCKWLEKRCYVGDWDTSSPRFFNKSSYFEVGGHNPKLALSEDKDLDVRFKKDGYKIVWSRNHLLHNEGRISPLKTFRNKYFWSQTGFEFLEAQPRSAIKQVLFIYFRPAYFRNFRLLLKFPHLTAGMFFLKTMELFGAVLGGLGTKLKFLKSINYKTEKHETSK